MELRNRIAYKGFDVDNNNKLLFCKPGLYKEYFNVGEIKEVQGELKLCHNGIHFCWDIKNVHNYYNLKEKVICEIEILGDVINESNAQKSCTNKIKVLRILTKEEVFKLSNIGSECTGICNSGNYNSGNYNSGYRNSGDCNSGNYNSGNYNSGYRNSGDCNSGNYNSGDYNSGYRNSGDCNSGNYNSGDYNSGDCNKTDYSNGFFNTIENKINLFNSPSNFTTKQFKGTEFYKALTEQYLILTEWVCYTDKEKENDKAKELIGGYLKRYNYKDACYTWWNKLSENNKQAIQQIPNFDKDIFFEITGIEL